MNLRNILFVAICTTASSAFADNEYSGALAKIASGPIAQWISAPVVLEAVRAQNAKTVGLIENQIIELDTAWRQQTISGGELIDGVLGNALSQYLMELKIQGQGRFTEIFVSDIRGLNVGQSDVTSDYWQGDEAKWQVPRETADIHIGNIEFDESTQSYQSQISVPIIEAGEFIGVITVGIDLERIAAAY